MNNTRIRKAMIDNDLRQKEVAAALGIRVESFSRLLRNPLSDEKEEKILKAILQLSDEKRLM